MFNFLRKRRRGCGHPPEARQHYRKGDDCVLCKTEFEKIIAVSYPERGQGSMVDGVPVIRPEQP